MSSKCKEVVLVTGGHGFIGHHVAKRLIKEGKEVVVLDNHLIYPTSITSGKDGELRELYYKRRQALKKAGEYTYIQGDVRDSWAEQLLVNGYDPKEITSLIHLANIPRQAEAQEMPNATADIMAGLSYIHELTDLKNAVFISSSMVYGDFDKPVDEEWDFNPKGIYGATRLVGEKFFEKLTGGHPNSRNLIATIIRPTAVYGPMDSTIRVVGKFIEAALKNQPIFVNGKNEVMDFTYVDDVVEGIYLAHKLKTGSGTISAKRGVNVFNISRGVEEITINLLAMVVTDIIGSDSSIYIKGKDDSMPSRHLLDCNNAQERLGYKSRVSLKEGLVKTVEDIKSRLKG